MLEALKVFSACWVLFLAAPFIGIVLSIGVISLLVALPVWGTFVAMGKSR